MYFLDTRLLPVTPFKENNGVALKHDSNLAIFCTNARPFGLVAENTRETGTV